MRIIFFKFLALFWFIPFGFYKGPLRKTGVLPHPLVPRNIMDLTLNKMMFPDNIMRAVVADKLAARGWIAERVGTQYLVPLYGICEDPAKLGKDYPLPCIIKSSHASGQVQIIRTVEDFAKVEKLATTWLSKEYRPKHEWVYRDIKPRLLIEKFLQNNGQPVTDIKFHCFFGEPVLVMNTGDQLYQNSINENYRHFMTPDWVNLDICPETQSKTPPPPKPDNYNEMLTIVRKLADGFDFIRVDLYVSTGKIYVGELTNFDAGGAFIHTPHEFDAKLFQKYEQMKKAKIDTLRGQYSKQVQGKYQIE